MCFPRSKGSKGAERFLKHAFVVQGNHCDFILQVKKKLALGDYNKYLENQLRKRKG